MSTAQPDILTYSLQEEQSIYRDFSTWRLLPNDCVGFTAVDGPQVKRWNAVYPAHAEYEFTLEDISAATNFFAEYKVPGHLISTNKKFVDASIETSVHFIYDAKKQQTTSNETLDIRRFLTGDDVPVDDFSNIVQAAFGLNSESALYFAEQMQKFAQRPGSIFWLVYVDRRAVAAASTFRTENNVHFLFNIATRPEYQRRGLCRHMMQHIVCNTADTIHTYSDTPAMYETILPQLGFTPIGTTYLIPVEKAATYLQYSR